MVAPDFYIREALRLFLAENQSVDHIEGKATEASWDDQTSAPTFHTFPI
jgi:hypothetical protein